MKLIIITSLFFLSQVAKSQTIENDPFLKRLAELKTIAEQPNGIIFKQNFNLKHKFKCLWGDSSKMELYINNEIYRFKSGLNDGLYIAFYNKEFTDTAMIAEIKNNEVNGVVKRWYNHKLEVEEYCLDGKFQGWRKIYFYDEEGIKFTNIQYIEEGGGIIDVITTF